MGKRYYCDYCDRAFVDDMDSRKKHLFGSMHKKLRKDHYDSFRTMRTILLEESAKPPCKRFFRDGECVFHSNCRYSHYLPQELEHLRRQVEEEDRIEGMKNMDIPIIEGEGPSLASWLQKRSQVQLSSNSSSDASTPVTWNLPPSLLNRPDLPPSLQPLKVEDFTSSEFETWG